MCINQIFLNEIRNAPLVVHRKIDNQQHGSIMLADQLRYRHRNQHLIGKTLSHCVSLAQSVGQIADKGKRYNANPRVIGAMVGAIQVGEYILTGVVPGADLVQSVIA